MKQVFFSLKDITPTLKGFIAIAAFRTLKLPFVQLWIPGGSSKLKWCRAVHIEQMATTFSSEKMTFLIALKLFAEIFFPLVSK
jgi:Na+-transporting methylmalonyl-CoA/oxaloacetate decarboxylase beta subunit